MTTFHFPFFNAGMPTAPYSVCATPMYYHHKPYPDAPANLVDFDAESSMFCRRRGPNRGAYCVVRSPQRDRIYSTAQFATAAMTAATVGGVSLASAAPALVGVTGAVVGREVQVTVGFKYGQRQFRSSLSLAEGDLVVVEGDRGEDMGRVLSITAGTADVQATAQVLRHATPADKRLYDELGKLEMEALREMRRIATQTHFKVDIVDVMYQLDGRKITVVICRQERRFVDFRRLQRAIFEVFRCRVWFAYLDEIEETKSTDVTRPRHRDPVSGMGANNLSRKVA